MEPGALQLRSDVLVKCYAVQTVTSPLSPRSDMKLLFRCQFHTSALSSHSLAFSASDLDLESPAQGRRRSLDGLRVEFKFSPTASTARCKLLWPSNLKAVIFICYAHCKLVWYTCTCIQRQWVAGRFWIRRGRHHFWIYPAPGQIHEVLQGHLCVCCRCLFVTKHLNHVWL